MIIRDGTARSTRPAITAVVRSAARREVFKNLSKPLIRLSPSIKIKTLLPNRAFFTRCDRSVTGKTGGPSIHRSQICASEIQTWLTLRISGCRSCGITEIIFNFGT